MWRNDTNHFFFFFCLKSFFENVVRLNQKNRLIFFVQLNFLLHKIAAAGDWSTLKVEISFLTHKTVVLDLFFSKWFWMRRFWKSSISFENGNVSYVKMYISAKTTTPTRRSSSWPTVIPPSWRPSLSSSMSPRQFRSTAHKSPFRLSTKIVGKSKSQEFELNSFFSGER